MHMQQYLPASTLQPFVKSFMIIESEQGMSNNLLPDTSIIMAFRLKGKVVQAGEGMDNELPLSVISGLRKTSRTVRYATDTATLLVLFKEGGAAAFFQEPMHELFESTVSLDSLVLRSKLEAVEEQLAEAANNRACIEIVEQFLLSALHYRRPDLLILDAIQQIKQTKGAIKIQELVHRLPISRDPFEKRFRRITGSSPKQFASIIRFRSLVHDHSAAGNLTGLAHTAGYFDQAHFIKDFKSFTGQTPHDFFASAKFW
jgi:methylphosphotriester-DNA--protein-cysteine methyltransferase